MKRSSDSTACASTLGNIALRAGRKIEWDGPNLRSTSGSIDDIFIHRDNRPGWAL